MSAPLQRPTIRPDNNNECYPPHHRGASKTRVAGGGRGLVWDGLDLRLGKRGRVLATVVPDNKYPKMWRVRSSEGLSDLANKLQPLLLFQLQSMHNLPEMR